MITSNNLSNKRPESVTKNIHQETLVFDLDNTLIMRDQAMLNCIENIFNRPLTIQQKNKIELEDQQGHSDRIAFCNWLKIFLNIENETEGIWNLIKNNIGDFVSLNIGAKMALTQLQSQYELVLLTNGGTQNQQRKIEKTNLNHFFTSDRIFISESIGFKKPDLRAFEWVQNQIGAASKYYMIGDHWENDIQGAKNFGWKAIHLSPNPLPTSNDNTTIRSITSLSQLNSRLNELRH